MKLTRRTALAAGAATVAVTGATPALARKSTIKEHPMAKLLRDHDATGLAELVRKREVSPSELLDAAIGEAERLNPRFNFMAQKHYEYARGKIAEGLPQGRSPACRGC